MTRFYKTIFTVEIVSDSPLEWDDINDIALEATLNSYRVAERNAIISEHEAAEFAVAVGDDPSWLGIEIAEDE
jgi:hypothetical protein